MERWIHSLLLKLGIETKQDFLQLMLQVIKFGIVGFVNTFLALFIYLILLKLKVYYPVALAIGEITSIFNAYFWSNRFVFKKKSGQSRNHKVAMLKVFVIYGFTFLLAEGLLILEVERLQFPEDWSAVGNLLITVPINFVLNKFWAFKDSKQ